MKLWELLCTCSENEKFEETQNNYFKWMKPDKKYYILDDPMYV